MVKVFVASDHAGYLFKSQLLESLKARFNETHQFEDLGVFDDKSVDYPDYADKVSQKVAKKEGLGILICGSGIGMCMRANRHKGVRAAQVWDVSSARLTRQHNDANIMCVGARLIPLGLANEMAQVFFTTQFEGGRHQGRVNKLDQ